MKRMIIGLAAVLILIVTNLAFAVPDKIDINFQLQTDAEGKLRGRGYPDSNYVWEGDMLVWEREITDEDGNKRIVKTYKKPFEIIADFKANSRIFGIEGNIEKIAVKKFGGALKGFVWLDNVSGGGEVILPFTAKHIFIARGDRFNPDLTEIGTDPNEDNYYEIIEGKTRVFVKSFSGIGGAAGQPPELIAHYKMNENTAGDNAELVTGGDFSSWPGDNPDGWTVAGEVGSDPEISEVGTGQGHGGAGTGMCNIYSSDGSSIEVYQNITLVVGRKYRVSINIDKVTTGGIQIGIFDSGWVNVITYTTNTTGVQNFTPFVATDASSIIRIINRWVQTADITFDNVSVKLCAVEDSSGNNHDGLAQQDTSAISVAGKINTAFDFNGSSDYIEIADHDDFTPALTLFSISKWVKMDDATNFIMASKGVYNSDGEWQLFTDGSDKLCFRLYDESVADCYIGIKSDAALTTYEGSWIHIVATYDGGDLSSGLKLHINSLEIASAADELNAGSFVSVENLAAPVHIGRYNSVYANGVIDNVTFFSLELTLEDVKYLYNNGDGREDWDPREPFLGRLNRPLDYQFRRGRYTF